MAEGKHNEEGLLICEKCGKPKERKLPLPGVLGKEYMTVPVMCDCERAAEEEREAKEQARAEKERIERMRSECFPASGFFKGCTFALDDGRSPDQSLICRKFVDTFDVGDPSGLLLWGSTGTGKSFMSSCIANACIDAGYSALQVDVGYVVNLMESSFSERAENLKRILGYDLLLIEDLGATRDTEYMMGHIYTLIDGRYKSGKPMVVTTNFALSGMTKVPSKSPWCRIFDRILERCYPVEFTATNRRTRNANAMRKAMRERLGITG